MSNVTRKILVLSDFDGQNANVIQDFLFCFNKHSRHDYYYIFEPRIINEFTDFSAFDVILLFWSLYLPGGALSKKIRQKIRQTPTLKVLFLQDEYRQVDTFARLVAELGIQVIFTLVPESIHHIIYPSHIIPSLEAIYTVLTGYVPTYLEAPPPWGSWERPIDIGYRSRALPYYLGDLARDKTVIAQRFQEISRRYGFRSDISVREEDRIYGRQWIEFLKASRFTLGSPSGSSVVDFTGDIRRNCENYLALNPGATYEEVKERFFADVDGRIVMDPISPRVFESAALGCVMVMLEGSYGGILKPGRHYICLKKDYSNMDEVVAQMKDNAYSRQVAENAYRDLIASGNFSYRKFVEWFDGVLDGHFASSSNRKYSKFSFYASNYFKFGQGLLPTNDRFISLPGRKLFGYLKKIQDLERNVRLYAPLLDLWRLPFFYFRGRLWKHIPFKLLIMDLSRLGLIYSLMNNKKNISVDFEVIVEYRSNWRMLSFVSYVLPAEEKTQKRNLNRVADGDEFDLSQFVTSLHKRDALLEWDHSPVETYLEYKYGRKTYSLDMGEDGHYRFDALILIAQHFPDLIADVLRPVINGNKHG